MPLRVALKPDVVVHLMKRKTAECLRCGMRLSPDRVVVFTESVNEYLSLPDGHVQCVRPA